MFPDFIAVRSFDLVSDQNVVSSESRSLITLARTLPGHRWSARFDIDIRPADTRKARAWLFSLQRDGAVVDYSDLDWKTNIAGRTVSAGVTKGNRDIPISSTAGVELGMMLNFDHPKLYMVEAMSAGQITVFPELHADIEINEPINFSDPYVELEIPPEVKRSALFSGQGLYDLSSFRIRMNEVRR